MLRFLILVVNDSLGIKMKKSVMILLCMVAGAAVAHDGKYEAMSTCHWKHKLSECPLTGEKVDVTIDVNADDVGKKGTFYAGIQTDTGLTLSRTSKGWTPNLTAYDYLDKTDKLPANQSFTIFYWEAGKRVELQSPGLTLCQLIQSQGSVTATIYAGYGAVQDEIQGMIENYSSMAVPAPTEHFNILGAFGDSQKNNKFSQVIRFVCDGNPVPDEPYGAPWVIK